MLISVIVPVYNVQHYLQECVESILMQTFKDFEIILVDDGSTDDSGKICDRYAAKYNNVRVIHKMNGGLSDARNFGIREAQGKYICFIDSDDFVAKDYIETLYNGIKKSGSQISACGYCRIYENGKTELINHKGIKKLYKSEEAQKYLCAIGYYGVAAWNKMYDIHLFDHISFPVGKNSEDCFIMYKLIEKAGSIYYDSDIKYFYRQRVGSIAHSDNINRFTIESNENVYNYYLSKGWNNAVPYAAQALAFAYIGIYNQFLKGSPIVNENEAQKCREKVLEIKDKITYEGLAKARKIQMKLFVFTPSLYDACFKIFEKMRETRYKKVGNN